MLKLSKMNNLLILVVILIIASLALHAIIPHSHPKALFVNDIQAALHGEDKKFWSLFIASLLAIASLLLKNDTLQSLERTYFSFGRTIAKIFNPFSVLLRNGLMHSKID